MNNANLIHPERISTRILNMESDFVFDYPIFYWTGITISSWISRKANFLRIVSQKFSPNTFDGDFDEDSRTAFESRIRDKLFEIRQVKWFEKLVYCIWVPKEYWGRSGLALVLLRFQFLRLRLTEIYNMILEHNSNCKLEFKFWIYAQFSDLENNDMV